MQERVDGERLREVVAGDAEAISLRFGIQRVGYLNAFTRTVGRFLKRNRLGEGDRAVAGVGDKFALSADFELVRAREFDVDLLRAVARRDSEDFFYVVACGSKLHVDAGVHVAQIDALVGVQVLGVFCGVGADGVTDFAFHWTMACGGFQCALAHCADVDIGVNKRFAKHPAGGALTRRM